jgi:hypothetical protein
MQYGFNYACTWSAVAAVGGKQTSTIRTDSNTDFIAKAIQFSASLNSAITFQSRANVTGIDPAARDGLFQPNTLATLPKLYRLADQNFGNVCGIGLHLLTLEFQTNDRPWQNIPLRADLCTGEPGTLYLLPDPVVIPANSTLQITLTNNAPNTTVGFSAAPSIDAMLVMAGLKTSRKPQPQ